MAINAQNCVNAILLYKGQKNGMILNSSSPFIGPKEYIFNIEW